MYDLQIFFSYFVGYLFIFLIMPYEAQKFLILMTAIDIYIYFFAYALDVISKKLMLNSRSQRFTLVFFF